MTTLSVFYQGEGIDKVHHLDASPDATFAVLKAALADKHPHLSEALLFVEGDEEPVAEGSLIKDRHGKTGLKVHLHRCRNVEVTVTFNRKTVERRFSPSTTVAAVKRWAAEDKFKMSPEEAGEHVLQIAGTHDRPAAGIHIGSLTNGKVCALAFDLVPDERVNGCEAV